MVRLAQDFSLNVPLVDGQGNFGSVGPKEYSDPPAAYRYTEARLTPAANDWLRDMRPEIVEYRPNFSERRQEPFVLPVSFPNLLVNGSKGIGWSLACDVPTHNLAEACEAAIVLAENPDATLEDLLAVMPGPDFPTGGIVVDPEELPEAYARGQGTFRLQGKYHIEQLPGNLQAIVVTELPYGVSPDQIVSEVVRAARAEKITDVTEMPKNLSDRNGLRVQIRCKRGGNVTKLVADLMRHTSLRVTIGINLTVVADGVPRQLDLREVVDRFVSFRFEVVTKRLEHERNELLRELHRLVALLAALDAIDAVIRIVRNAEDDDDAREKLKSELRVELHGNPRAGADRRRAGAVHPRHADQAPVAAEPLQAPGGARGEGPPRRRDRAHPRRLRRAPRDRGRRAAHHRREARRATAHAARRRDARSPPARRPAPPPARADVAIVAAPRTDVVLFATRGGACAARPLDGRVSRVPLKVGAGDAVATAVFTDTESELNAYTSDGQVLRLRVADVPIESRVSRGTKAVALSPRLRPRLAAAAGAGRRARAARHRAGRDQALRGRRVRRARTWADHPPSTCPTATAWSPSSPTATATRSCCTRRTAARCGSMPARCGR